MENTEKLYENLMARLKTQPHLAQAEDLQKEIMKRIECQDGNKKKMNFYHFTSIISGAAACLLAVLFTWETVQSQTNYYSERTVMNRQTDVENFQNISFSATNDLENLKTIASIMQQKQIENKKREQFYTSLLNIIN